MKRSSSTLSVALAQINCCLGDFEYNTTKILAGINKAKKLSADLIVFPELAICGYPPEDLLLKPHFIKQCQKEIRRIAKTTKKITAIVGFPERANDGKLYNSAAVLTDGKIHQIYHKVLLPNYGVFDERRYFSPGNFKNVFFELKEFNIALTICEDIWVPGESVIQALAQKNPDLLLNLSASPYSLSKENQRNLILKNAADTVRSHVLYCNLVGAQDELIFDGGSRALNAKGQTIQKMKTFDEDFRVIRLKKQKPSNSVLFVGKQKQILKTKNKPQILEDLLKALELGIHDYVRKNKFSKVVIGLSGGIDSALVAVLATRALGKKSVIGVTMPSVYSSKETFSDAIACADACGIKCLTIPIQDVQNTMLESLSAIFKNTATGVAEENMQARIRGTLLMSLSNKFNWLVLTTGNKSELATGYCTLYGDMCGGFAPIKDISKTLVYKLSRYLNRLEGRQVIPASIIRRAPSAELRPDQKDQDSLPNYSDLDRLLEQYVENDLPLNQIKSDINSTEIKKMIALVNRNEYKRRQAPIGSKVTDKAFGRDRRIPITNRFPL